MVGAYRWVHVERLREVLPFICHQRIIHCKSSRGAWLPGQNKRRWADTHHFWLIVNLMFNVSSCCGQWCLPEAWCLNLQRKLLHPMHIMRDGTKMLFINNNIGYGHRVARYDSQYHRWFGDVSNFLFARSVSNLFEFRRVSENKDGHWRETQSQRRKGL